MGRVGVLLGGPSPEHDISILTGLLAARVLAEDGRDVALLYWSKVGGWHELPADLEAKDFAQGVPAKGRDVEFVSGGEAPGFWAPGSLGRRRAVELDLVVNCCHGGAGEDGRLQGALDLAGIPYTGPAAPAAALGMDKLAFGAVVEAAGLPTLPRIVLDAGEQPSFDGPYIVKPRFGGSSIGIEVVGEYAAALALKDASVHLRAGAVVEPYRKELVDLLVNVRTFPELQLSMIERPRREADSAIFGYEQKYLGDNRLSGAGHERPAQVPAAVEEAVTAATRRLAVHTQVRGSARLDFLWAPGTDDVWVNEINTIPGTLGLYLWRESGLTPQQLLRDLCQEATARPSQLAVTAGADSRALLDADAIRNKLS